MPIGSLVKLIPTLIGVGGSIAGGLAGNKTNQTTSTTTANYTPEQKAVQDMILKIFQRQINKGEKVAQHERNAVYGGINRTYDVLGDRLTTKLTGQGYGESGKVGKGFQDLEISRANDIQQAEGSLQARGDQRMLQLLGLAEGFARPTGQTTVTQSPKQSPWASIIPGVANSVATSIWLKKLLGGGDNLKVSDPGAYSGDDFGFPDYSNNPWDSNV